MRSSIFRQDRRLFAVVVLHQLLVLAQARVTSHHYWGRKEPHGGVPMGVRRIHCDDGKNNLEIDWDSSSTTEYTCDGAIVKNEDHRSFNSCEATAKRPIHICYPAKVEYDEDIPTSGHHRPLWPKYGEYRYLPPQRWVHSIEHGAIVFLYHPCADPEQVNKLKAIATQCLRRHIITPSKRIPKPSMFAVVAWRCKLLTTYPDVDEIIQFIKEHALDAPERSVYGDGQYSLELINPAKEVSDIKDSTLCPNVMPSLTKSTDKIMARSSRRLALLKKSMKRMESENERFGELLRSLGTV